jgi:hypothetical protein
MDDESVHHQLFSTIDDTACVSICTSYGNLIIGTVNSHKGFRDFNAGTAGKRQFACIQT